MWKLHSGRHAIVVHNDGRSSNGTIANGTVLRILPLGNSITWGLRSSDGNGYRLYLQNLLSNNTVQYVGSQQSGNMTNNHNEGHPGALISQIASYAKASLWEQPNLVLVMAGTNDMNVPVDPRTAPQRLGNLIDEVVSACPIAAVIVAQLIPAAEATIQARIQVYNDAIPGVVAKRASRGKKVLVVDMDDFVTKGDLIDTLHPTDHGYAQMAAGWYDAIVEADRIGWIEALANATDPNG